MLTIPKHRLALVRILQDIYKDNELAAQLVFKGGTCLMLFYDLDRFSTDLDFNLRDEDTALDIAQMNNIVKKTIDVGIERDGRFTYLWSGHYEKGQRTLKVEVSKRNYPQKIVNKTYYGLTIPTLAKEQMLAHKLCAMSERVKNRDFFDAYFMLDKLWDIDEEIIQIRTNMTVREYLSKLVKTIDTSQVRRNVLAELGEVLDDKQKNWARDHLIDELKTQLLVRIDSLAKP
jgi:predicted nucleotidyltransferase component of viral defense system